MKITLIVAASTNNVIGVDGTLPWRLPDDMEHFKKVTTGHWALMGRKTYESIPAKFRPLPGRTNLVLSRNAAFEAPGATVVSSWDDVVRLMQGCTDPAQELFIAGGEHLYRMFLGDGELAHVVDRILLSRVHTAVNRLRDVSRIPAIDETKWAPFIARHHPAGVRNEHSFTIMEYTRRP